MRIRPIRFRLGRKKGFSLLEALLSIVVILAAGLGVVELFISADKKNKLQTTEQTVQQVASAAAQLLSATYDPADTISTVDVINSGLLSQNVIVNSNIQGPYGTISVASDSASSATHEMFKITASGLPYDQAVGFCQNMFGNFAVLGSDNKAITKTSDCATKFKGVGSDKISVTIGYPRADYLAASS